MNFMRRISAVISKIKVWGIAGIVSYLRRKSEYLIQKRKLVRCVRMSLTTEPQRGITVIGELTGQVSLSKTMRDFILNLQDAGIPCQTYDTCLKPQIPLQDVARIVTPVSDFDIGRYTHIVMMYRSPLPDGLLPKCKRVRIAFYDSEYGIHEMLTLLQKMPRHWNLRLSKL